MFSNFSWGVYLEIVLITITLYYLVIGVFYFKDEIQKFILLRISGLKNSSRYKVPEESWIQKPDNASSPEEQNHSLFRTAQALRGDLKITINKAAKQKLMKEELITALTFQLKKFKNLKGTAFHVSINNQIQVEVKSNCSICLNEEIA